MTKGIHFSDDLIERLERSINLLGSCLEWRTFNNDRALAETKKKVLVNSCNYLEFIFYRHGLGLRARGMHRRSGFQKRIVTPKHYMVRYTAGMLTKLSPKFKEMQTANMLERAAYVYLEDLKKFYDTVPEHVSEERFYSMVTRALRTLTLTVGLLGTYSNQGKANGLLESLNRLEEIYLTRKTR